MSDTPEQAYIEEQARQIIYAHPHFSSSGRVFDFKYQETATLGNPGKRMSFRHYIRVRQGIV